MLLPLWQIVLIGVCGALVLGVLTVLFGALLCCGCKASKKWGRREYYTGPSESLTTAHLRLCVCVCVCVRILHVCSV